MKIRTVYVCKTHCFTKNPDICVCLVHLYKLVPVGSLNTYSVCATYVATISGKACLFLVNIVNFSLSRTDLIKKPLT